MSENKQAPIKFTDAHLEYVRQYGGSCRDCADENGVCPSSGLPCANSAKAIKHVLDALEYGINHGYAPPIESAVLSASAGEKKDASEMLDLFEAEQKRILMLDPRERAMQSVYSKVMTFCYEFRQFIRATNSMQSTKEEK